MLELIAKSKIRQRIILLFTFNRGKEYYINEIARIVKTSSGTTRRELRKLVRSSFLKFEKKTNAVYYRLNEGNPLLKDLESIIKKTIGIETLLRDELHKVPAIEYAFVFGSYAKKEFKSDSDIDLYVIGKVSEDRIHRAIRNVES